MTAFAGFPAEDTSGSALMGASRFKFSIPDAPGPVVPAIGRIRALLAGRVHPVFNGGSGAASSHQEVVAQV